MQVFLLVEFKVENLCGFLIRSKLMSPDEMLAMRQRWHAETKDPTQATVFLKWLVGKAYVTEYQASLLSRGHVDDFFLGEYKVLERIGRGRMAGVYKAVHPSGQVVAIKVLPPSKAKNGQILARFQREARLAVKLKNPHVVRSFQLGQTKGVHFLVMEYLEGEPLDELLLRRKRLTPSEAVRLIHQALLGLQHIHECGLVHRDLKPANLIVAPAPARGDREITLKSNIKILDIGLAREFFDENAPPAADMKDDLTEEGVLLGTPDYLAPEQARDPRAIDIRADIYSLGCTLYHFLTGQPPFPDQNLLNQIIRHATEAPKPLTDFVPNLPVGLGQIVAWMMAKQPENRYPTPARAAQALEAFLMVTASDGAQAEESPQMKRYLTYLEMSEKRSADAAVPPPSKAPVLAGKSALNPVTPPAAPKPGAIPEASMAAPKRKRRTGVKMPEAAPTSPAHVPIPTAAPIAPLGNTPGVTTPPLVEARPGETPAADQLDVELVGVTAAPVKKGLNLSRRDLTLIGIGAGIALLLCGLCGGAILTLRSLTGG